MVLSWLIQKPETMYLLQKIVYNHFETLPLFQKSYIKTYYYLVITTCCYDWLVISTLQLYLSFRRVNMPNLLCLSSSSITLLVLWKGFMGKSILVMVVGQIMPQKSYLATDLIKENYCGGYNMSASEQWWKQRGLGHDTGHYRRSMEHAHRGNMIW